MNFKDPQLQRCYDRNLVEADNVCGDLRRIQALIATYDLFHLLEGAHSARVHATVEHLLSAGLRLELRRWYQRPDAKMDSTAVEFREQLSQLAGERLEITTEISHNPT